MEVRLFGSELKWVKANGEAAAKPVSALKRLRYSGFSIPNGDRCKSVNLVAGDPLNDPFVIIEASGNNWFGTFVLGRKNGACIEIRQSEVDSVWKSLADKLETVSLADHVGRFRDEKRRSVNVNELAQKVGLCVWQNDGFLWCPEAGEFDDLPDGWDFLPSGDSALTRRVRRGPHWVVLEKRDEHSETRGTYAPLASICAAYEALGGRNGVVKRRKSKSAGQEKREALVSQALRETIMSLYPKIPQQDLKVVLETSRASGHVARSAILYFASEADRTASLKSVAQLATRAHIRHVHTRYEELLSEGVERDTARSEILIDVDDVEESWKAHCD